MKYLVSIVFILSGYLVKSQQLGDQLYNDSILHEVRIIFADDDWYSILTNNFEAFEHVPYLMGDIIIDGELIDSIGVRWKGFTSYVSDDKKPIKVDLNEFVPGKSYDGLKKFNLNNGFADPSIQRDFLCYNVLRKNSVAAPRTAYAKVYINDEYFGCYMLVEQVDKAFLTNNFKNNDGNLYKNTGWSNHEYLGDEGLSYSPPFELRTNRDSHDYNSLAVFADKLNNSSNLNFEEEIHSIFNVDRYLRTLAVDVVTNNWDSYLEHGRNWYIYEDFQSGKMQWIPWDYNLALGGSFGFGGGPGGGGSEELDGVCGLDSVSLCPTIINGAAPYPASDTIQELVMTMDCFCCQNEWDGICEDAYQAILNGEDPGGGGPGGGGGGGFGPQFEIDQRNNGRQLIGRLLSIPSLYDRYTDIVCSMMNHNFTRGRLENIMDHNAEIISDAVMEDANFLYSQSMYDSDMYSNNGLRGYIADRIDIVRAELSDDGVCDQRAVSVFGEVTINEIVASNDSIGGIADEFGEYNDWIELYNNTEDEIDLTGAYISDNPDNPTKWEFPTGSVIPAGGYYILWADEDQEQGPNHTNFKLSKAGEQLYLWDENLVAIDSLIFGEQETNMGYARVPNGTGMFTIQEMTFNANNESNTINQVAENLDVEIYPIPAKDQINLVIWEHEYDRNYTIEIINSIGQVVARQLSPSAYSTLDVSSYPSGIYYIQIADDRAKGSTQKVIVQK